MARLVAIIAAVFFVAGAASADPTPAERQLAESFFERGRQLMESGKFSEACPLLAESQRLDPGGGTLLNLAFCHEKEGRLATAYTEYGQALAAAVSAGRQDREATARERIAQLASIVPTLSLGVSPSAEVPGLQVTLDGTPLPRLAWGVPTRVDPGEHQVGASAPGHERWVTTVTITGPGDHRVIDVPRLPRSETKPPDGQAPPIWAPQAAPAACPAGTSWTPTGCRQQEPAKTHFSTGTYVVGGIGLGALGFAAIAGVVALNKQSNADDLTAEQCVAGRQYCEPEAEARVEAEVDASRTWAWISTGALAGGAIALLIAWSMPREVEQHSREPSSRWSVSVRPTSGSVSSAEGVELRLGRDWF